MYETKRSPELNAILHEMVNGSMTTKQAVVQVFRSRALLEELDVIDPVERTLEEMARQHRAQKIIERLTPQDVDALREYLELLTEHPD